MKTAIAWLAALGLIEALAGDIQDLGVISSRRAIWLDRETTRRDFAGFIVELLPQTPPTNVITIATIKELLTVEEMAIAGVNSGRVRMGVRTRWQDGSESEVALYAFELRRGNPPKPSARAVAVSDIPGHPKSATDEIQRVRNEMVAPPAPPAPAKLLQKMPQLPSPTIEAFRQKGLEGLKRAEAARLKASRSSFQLPDPPDPPDPLPGGRNHTYGQHVDEMADFYARQRRQ